MHSKFDINIFQIISKISKLEKFIFSYISNFEIILLFFIIRFKYFSIIKNMINIFIIIIIYNFLLKDLYFIFY